MPTDTNDARLLVAAFGGGRASSPRLAIARAAERSAGAFSVEDLARRASEALGGRVATATAYRAVAAMVATGYLEHLGVRDGTALYARCSGAGHHHHLVCTSCGAIAEAPCPLAGAVGAHAQRAGFRVTGHEVAIYGVCARCSDEAGRR